MPQKREEPAKDAVQQAPVGKQLEKDVESVVKEAEEEVAASRRTWYQSVRWGRVLLTVYAILIALFALLAWWVHIHPVLSVDVTITREFQENQSPWLRDSMIAVSYIVNTLPLSLGLVVLAAVLLWVVRLYLEAVTVMVVIATI